MTFLFQELVQETSFEMEHPIGRGHAPLMVTSCVVACVPRALHVAFHAPGMVGVSTKRSSLKIGRWCLRCWQENLLGLNFLFGLWLQYHAKQ